MTMHTQHPLPLGEHTVENPSYLSDQLITYIGNKRSLLTSIEGAIALVQREIGGRKLRTLDAFSGSGVVSRLLKSCSSTIYANDIEDYARIISQCYLMNSNDVSWGEVDEAIQRMNDLDLGLTDQGQGLFERLYAPRDEDNITPDDRVFYTKMNARRLDTFRCILNEYSQHAQISLLGPLLSEASIHANTAGVFKGFYKDRVSGAGRFGGTGADALLRILGPIQPQRPILSNYSTNSVVLQEDANRLVNQVGDLDLTYIDPPYNQHPYGSNYFMLNLLVNYQEPHAVSKVSGIPVGWKRSEYNVRSRAANRLAELVNSIDSKYLLISYNDEGFIAPEEMRKMLSDVGTITEYSTAYNTFRGSRNLNGRKIHVTEHLFLVKKG